MGVVGESLIQAVGYNHICAVDGGEHATNDDGAEHRTCLVGGLRDRGCRTSLTRRHAGEHQVVRNGLRNTDAGTEHNEDQDNHQVVVRTQEGEHRERGSVERQTERHHLRRVEVHRHARNHQTGDNDRQGTGNQQHTGVHGRQTGDQLQVLGGEVDEANVHHHGDEVCGNRAGEHGVAEEAHIQHGLNIVLLAVELTQHEQDNEAQAGKDGANSHRIEPGFGGVSQTEGNAGHAGHNQQDAQRIHRAGVRVLRLGNHNRGENQQRNQNRHSEQEHRTPVEVLQQETTHNRAQRRTRREARSPHGNSDAALGRIHKDIANNRQGCRHEHGAKNAKQGAGNHEHQRGGRECRERRDCREAGRADEQQLAATDAVTDSAHGHEQGGEHQGVGVNDPQLLRGGGAQRLSDCGHREGKHCVVDGDQEHREHEHTECRPALGLLVGGVNGQSRGVRIVIRHGLFSCVYKVSADAADAAASARPVFWARSFSEVLGVRTGP